MAKIERTQVAEDCNEHDDCTIITITRIRQKKAGREFQVESISHAPDTAHLDCRVGDESPEVEDRRGGKRTGKKVGWKPQCDDCLALLNVMTPLDRLFGQVSLEEVRRRSLHRAHKKKIASLSNTIEYAKTDDGDPITEEDLLAEAKAKGW